MSLTIKNTTLLICFLLSSCARIETHRSIASTSEDYTSCSEVFSSFITKSSIKTKLHILKKDLFLINVDDYKKQDSVTKIIQRFKVIVTEIKNVDDFFIVLDFLKEISATRRIEESTTHLFASKVQMLISSTNFKSKILDLSKSMSSSDKFTILSKLKEIDNIVKLMGSENQRNITFMSIRGHIKDIELIFDPNSYVYFIDEIIDLTMAKNAHSTNTILAEKFNRFLDDGEIYIQKDIFSLETSRIINSLPPEVQKKARDYAFKKYTDFIKVNNKDMRRNMEFLIRAFSQDDFKNLKKSINQENYIEKINNIFKTVNPRVSYEFEDVLSLVKTIQENLTNTMLKDNESLYIYGSLPNGKANLEVSDIDIHFHSDGFQRNKDSLSKWQILANDPELKEFRNKYELQKVEERGKSNIENLINTENKLAESLNRSAIKQGSLLGSIADDSDFFKIDKLGVYNSIILEVFTDKIRIHIIDVFSKEQNIKTLDI